MPARFRALQTYAGVNSTKWPRSMSLHPLQSGRFSVRSAENRAVIGANRFWPSGDNSNLPQTGQDPRSGPTGGELPTPRRRLATSAIGMPDAPICERSSKGLRPAQLQRQKRRSTGGRYR